MLREVARMNIYVFLVFILISCDYGNDCSDVEVQDYYNNIDSQAYSTIPYHGNDTLTFLYNGKDTVSFYGTGKNLRLIKSPNVGHCFESIDHNQRMDILFQSTNLGMPIIKNGLYKTGSGGTRFYIEMKGVELVTGSYRFGLYSQMLNDVVINNKIYDSVAVITNGSSITDSSKYCYYTVRHGIIRLRIDDYKLDKL